MDVKENGGYIDRDEVFVTEKGRNPLLGFSFIFVQPGPEPSERTVKGRIKGKRKKKVAGS